MQNQISAKTMCIITNDGKLLVNKGYDKVKKETFYRLIGGKVEFGEKNVDAVKREIKEELGVDVSNLKFITAKEEIFTYVDTPGHEVIFLFSGKIADKKVLNSKEIANPDSNDFPAVWIPIKEVLENEFILYPSFNYKKIFSKLK